LTTEEEALFRTAARAALAHGGSIAMVAVDGEDATGPAPFSVFELEHPVMGASMAILILVAWESEPDAEDRCQAIIREEHKALAGQSLD